MSLEGSLAVLGLVVIAIGIGVGVRRHDDGRLAAGIVMAGTLPLAAAAVVFAVKAMSFLALD